MPIFPRVGRRQPLVRASYWVVFGILCLGVFLHLVPFYYMFITSIKSGTETLQVPPTLWPQHPTLAAWQLTFSIVGGRTQSLLPVPFYVYFGNSLFMAGMTLLLSLPITSLAAYASSKLVKGPVGRWIFIVLIGTLMVPGVVTLLPRLMLTLNFPFAVPEGSVPVIPGSEDPFPTWRIWDTPWAIILPAVFSAFNFLLFKGFFDTIPNSILQAARVDGGSEFNIFRRIVLPMSVPVYAVSAWMMFGEIWDGNFLWATLTITTPDRIPTSVAIYNLINLMTKRGTTGTSAGVSADLAQRLLIESGMTWNGLIVLGLLQTLPIFLMFIICREYLMKGVRIRGLK